jgi:hypothetical protein
MRRSQPADIETATPVKRDLEKAMADGNTQRRGAETIA